MKWLRAKREITSALSFLGGKGWGVPVANSLTVEVVQLPYGKDRHFPRQIGDRAATVASGRRAMFFAIHVSTFRLPSQSLFRFPGLDWWAKVVWVFWRK
jgi:hypothetical protein